MRTIKLDDRKIQKITTDYNALKGRINNEKDETVKIYERGLLRGMRKMLKELNIEIENVTYDPDYEENKMWKRIAETETLE